MPNRPPSFPLQRMIFLAVSLVLCVQVGWWLNVQLRESSRLLQARVQVLKGIRTEAWAFDTRGLLGGSQVPAAGAALPAAPPSLEARRANLQRAFPHVQVVAAPMAPDDPMLLDGAGFLTLRPGPLEELESQRWHTMFRALTEGAFMVAVVLSGLVLLYRKLSEELDLRLRQRNFTSAVTHELKTPIASLQVWTETLFTRTLPEEQKARIRTLMQRDLDRLDELVGNILDAARAESGSLVLHQEPLEVGPWLRGVCEAMDHRLGPGSLGLRLELGPDSLWVHGDPKALGTVVENLLSNAWKYAAEPRETTVTLDGDGDEVLLVVSDRGHGMTPKDQARVFHRFFRAGDEMTRQVPGTGLGLYLVKEIVTRHGGRVQASSKGPGLGSAFIVRLPRLPRPADA